MHMSKEKSKTMHMHLSGGGRYKRCIMGFVQVENLRFNDDDNDDDPQ